MQISTLFFSKVWPTQAEKCARVKIVQHSQVVEFLNCRWCRYRLRLQAWGQRMRWGIESYFGYPPSSACPKGKGVPDGKQTGLVWCHPGFFPFPVSALFQQVQLYTSNLIRGRNFHVSVPYMIHSLIRKTWRITTWLDFIQTAGLVWFPFPAS